MLEEMRQSSNSPVMQPKKRQAVALTPEELQPLDPTEGVMPEVVADRMLKRVVPFAGLPVVGGILVFAGFWYANKQLELDIPPTIVAYATQAMLLLSFAGITYGVMSTQLDEDADQSLLGTENLKRNLDLMRGAEEERIADTKEFEQLAEAEKAGIVMTPAAADKRQRELRQKESGSE
jgi:hypothetical protein